MKVIYYSYETNLNEDVSYSFEIFSDEVESESYIELIEDVIWNKFSYHPQVDISNITIFTKDQLPEKVPEGFIRGQEEKIKQAEAILNILEDEFYEM